MTLIEQFAAAKAAGDYQRFIDSVPYARFLNLTAAMVNEELITTMRYSDHLIGNPAPCQLPGFVVPFCGIPGLIALPALPPDTQPLDLLWITHQTFKSNGTGPRGTRYLIFGV